MPEQISLYQSIAEIDRNWWNRQLADNYPFLRHEFLLALEQGDCLHPFGWRPTYAVLQTATGDALAAAPLYHKDNTFGEFVFDGAWADAYARAGRQYYPKLVIAAPYSPATGPRLLAVDNLAAQRLVHALPQVCETLQCSSVHCLFPDQATDDTLDQAHWLSRQDVQFHWFNHNYTSFDDFTQALTAKKRKNIRQERQRVDKQGFHFIWRHGAQMDDDEIALMRGLYASIYERKWGYPALSEAFFLQLARMPNSPLSACFACHGTDALDKRVAVSIFLRSDTHLYGRYWGCREEFDALHFECCYYQGIEMAIAEGLQVFEPGAQGEHKIARGFIPTIVRSRHYLVDQDFQQALHAHLKQERRFVQQRLHTLQAHSPYRTKACS